MSGAAPIRRRLELVIFDCDGVLVDSERLAVRVGGRGPGPSSAGRSPRREVVDRFVGRSSAYMHAEVERELGRSVDWDADVRVAAREVFDAELVAIDGVAEAVGALLRSARLAVCVASSSTHDAIEFKLTPHRAVGRLRRCGLQRRGRGERQARTGRLPARGAPRWASRRVVRGRRGQPDRRRGGLAAGMTVFAFAGGVTSADAARGRPGCVVFDEMATLPALLDARAPRRVTDLTRRALAGRSPPGTVGTRRAAAGVSRTTRIGGAPWRRHDPPLGLRRAARRAARRRAAALAGRALRGARRGRGDRPRSPAAARSATPSPSSHSSGRGARGATGRGRSSPTADLVLASPSKSGDDDRRLRLHPGGRTCAHHAALRRTGPGRTRTRSSAPSRCSRPAARGRLDRRARLLQHRLRDGALIFTAPTGARRSARWTKRATSHHRRGDLRGREHRGRLASSRAACRSRRSRRTPPCPRPATRSRWAPTTATRRSRRTTAACSWPATTSRTPTSSTPRPAAASTPLRPTSRVGDVPQRAR